MSAELRIEDLVLRVPGLSPGEARQLAEEVARLVARDLPDAGAGGGAARTLPSAIDLRVRMVSGAPRERIAAAIAARIVEALR